MIDEERRKLCYNLRHYLSPATQDVAADEIERPAALAQSDAEPQTLRDAAENLLIAIGMGWDLDGCVENLRAALAQSDAEPAAWRETLTAARDEIISLLPQDWFENGFLKEPHPVIREIDTALAATPRPDASPTLDEIEAAMDRVLERHGFKTTRPDASVGLIEAAEIAEALASDFSDRPLRNVTDILYGLAKNLRNRARAADRSGE